MAAVSFFFCACASAKTVFLPDWQETTFEKDGNDTSRDENWCITAEDKSGTRIYHKGPTCPAPKIHDTFCAHDKNYISECYCPYYYNKTCANPFIGDTRVTENGYASCDGKFIACCNDSCPSGYSKTSPGGCGGSMQNDCGHTCYAPYKPCCTPASSESGCSCGTYSCGDGCGGSRTCCSSCPTSGGSSGGGSSGSGSSSGGGGGGGVSCSSVSYTVCGHSRTLSGSQLASSAASTGYSCDQVAAVVIMAELMTVCAIEGVIGAVEGAYDALFGF